MARFIVWRGIQAVIVLALSSAVLFYVMHILPGDPAALIAGPDAKPADVEAIRHKFGLDGPLINQYGRWLGDLVKGDFGQSLRGNRPVSERLTQAIPPTLELALASLFVALLLGVPLGVMAGARPGSRWDYGLATFAGFALGIPGFFLGILALLLFAIRLDWLPASGRVSFTDNPVEAFRHLLLPAVTLGLSSAAVFARFVRGAVVESMRDDYVRTAWAKGLQERRIILAHVLPNSFIPLITAVALQTGRLLGGAIITEQVFAWPGLGRLVVDAVLQRDYMVVQGVLVLFVVTFVGVNFLADIAYGVADPRVRAT
jgi:ABC-type dipeptide/oligopeptide/nickel transport system permease component